MGVRIPFRVYPMLATLARKPVDQPGWVYEEKYDGYRILAYKEGDHMTLLSRNAKDHTETFPGVAGAVRKLKAVTLLLDGEVVAFDHRGVSRFQLLQKSQAPPQYAAFDCLYRDGRDLRSQPLSIRRAALEEIVARGSRKKHYLRFCNACGNRAPGIRVGQASMDLRVCSPKTLRLLTLRGARISG